jgi:Protein of unknown function (DUF1641)
MSMNLEPMTQTPRKAADLERIEARLERIEAMLARFDAAANLVPGLVAMTSDIADEWATRDGRVDARLTEALQLLKRATRPEVLQSLQTLVGQLEAAPGMFAMVGDMVDDFARRAEANGVDLHQATATLFATLEALVKLLGQPEIRDLLDSGVLSPGAVSSMNMAARAFAEAGRHPSTRMGLLSAFSKTRDPDVQRALGFLLITAKTLGQSLAAEDASVLPPPRLEAPRGG